MTPYHHVILKYHHVILNLIQDLVNIPEIRPAVREQRGGITTLFLKF
jgi:hypothetical protein